MADNPQQSPADGNPLDPAKQWLSDPKNLATAVVLAAALAQPRERGRGGLATVAQRGVGALQFRGQLETGIAGRERQRTQDTNQQENALRQQALQGEQNKIASAGVETQRRGQDIQRDISTQSNRTQLSIHNTPQARDASAQGVDQAQAGYYNRLPAFAPNDKIDLKSMFTQDAAGAKALMSSVASIASMTDPLERSKMLADYFPLMGQFGIVMGQDQKTGKISFQVPDALEAQIRAMGGSQAPVPPGTQPTPGGTTPPAPQNLNADQVLQEQGRLQQQKQQRDTEAANAMKANAGAYRAARTKFMTLSDMQLKDLEALSKSMDTVTQQALADERMKRQSAGPPMDPRRPGTSPIAAAPMAPYRQPQ